MMDNYPQNPIPRSTSNPPATPRSLVPPPTGWKSNPNDTSATRANSPNPLYRNCGRSTPQMYPSPASPPGYYQYPARSNMSPTKQPQFGGVPQAPFPSMGATSGIMGNIPDTLIASNMTFVTPRGGSHTSIQLTPSTTVSVAAPSTPPTLPIPCIPTYLPAPLPQILAFGERTCRFEEITAQIQQRPKISWMGDIQREFIQKKQFADIQQQNRRLSENSTPETPARQILASRERMADLPIEEQMAKRMRLENPVQQFSGTLDTPTPSPSTQLQTIPPPSPLITDHRFDLEIRTSSGLDNTLSKNLSFVRAPKMQPGKDYKVRVCVGCDEVIKKYAMCVNGVGWLCWVCVPEEEEEEEEEGEEEEEEGEEEEEDEEWEDEWEDEWEETERLMSENEEVLREQDEWEDFENAAREKKKEKGEVDGY